MYLCEMCFIRIYTRKHAIHTNIEQTPSTHHFCSKQCLRLWVEFVQELGVPKTYVEVFK